MSSGAAHETGAQVGDLVDIYVDPHQPTWDGWTARPGPRIPAVGIVTAIAGYKTTVLVDGTLHTAVFDPETMKLVA